MSIKLNVAELAQANYMSGDEPEERFWKLGPKALSNVELLSLLLIEKRGADRIALAGNILKRFNGFLGIHKTPLIDLNNFPDMKTAMLVKAAIELGSRMLQEANPLPVINSPADAADIVRYDMAGMDHEELWVILLDRRNRVMDVDHVYKGSVSSNQVRVGELFKQAISMKASAIIPCHNHPTGDPTPSSDDVAVTRAIVQAGKLLDIECLDHVVIGGDRWISLKERGLGFS